MSLTRREREQQERESFIISKAIDLFSERGFENVSMDLIAKESEFTKRTLYRYFISKGDLYFAAALQGHSYLFDMLFEAIEKGTSGFEKIHHAYYAYYEYCKKYPYLAQLVNKRQYSKLDDTDLNAPFYKKFLEKDQTLFQKLHKTYQLGIQDGSIRSDVDVDYLTYSTIYLTVSFFHLYTFTGQTYSAHFGLDQEKFVLFTLEQMLEQIKPSA